MPSASELVQSCTTVFTLPEIYFRVRERMVDDPNSTTDDLAEVLKMDPAISARFSASSTARSMGFPSRSIPFPVPSTSSHADHQRSGRSHVCRTDVLRNAD